MSEGGNDEVIGKVIDRIFETPKNLAYLLAIFMVGFILRLIAAINLSVSADDMHFVTHAINFFSADRLVTYDQSSGLWFAFTSVIYKIFGMTQLTSRMAPLIFGSFSILVIYLLSKEFFDEKTSLCAAFLLAIAPFHIKNTIAEMDVTAMFFVLTAMFLFVKSLKNDRFRYFALSGIFMGLAIYTKVYPLLFIPSLLLYFAYYNRKHNEKIFKKRNIKKILVFLFFIFIFTIPALAHNYLLYSDKGFMDLQFTRTFGIGEDVSAQYYSWDAQFEAKNSWAGLIFGDTKHVASGAPLLYTAVMYIFKGDPLNFVFGVIGILLILFYRKTEKNENREKGKEYIKLFVLSILFVLPFLASIILLPKHYLFLEILLIPFSAFTLISINNLISKGKNKNYLKVFVAIIFIFSLIYLGLPPKADIHHFYGESHVGQVINYKNKNIAKDSLIIADNRIYLGRSYWMFQERPFLEVSDFLAAAQESQKIAGETKNVGVYYFECVIDDCGWGYIKGQPEFNKSMEDFTALFATSGKLVKEIYEPMEKKPYYPLFVGEKEQMINVYYAEVPLKQAVIDYAKKPKVWFLYPIGYQPSTEVFDNYQPISLTELLVDKTARGVVILALILAFLSPIYILYLLYNSKK
ncbi:glycosyltransferase family 39 protein [Candidatus Pacearchaeota archaeon]|nr:glycosyltransferase family 39 protein [Candidatus Pacearchaeota archaeon]